MTTVNGMEHFVLLNNLQDCKWPALICIYSSCWSILISTPRSNHSAPPSLSQMHSALSFAEVWKFWHCSLFMTTTLIPFFFASLISTYPSGICLDETPPGKYVLTLLLSLPQFFSCVNPFAQWFNVAPHLLTISTVREDTMCVYIQLYFWHIIDTQ